MTAAAASAVAQTVHIWPDAVVDRGNVVLRDVASIDGFDPEMSDHLVDLSLTPSPLPGLDKVVSLTDIRDRLRAAGVNMAAVSLRGSSACVVHRPRPIPGDPAAAALPQKPAPDRTLRAEIHRTLESRLPASGGRLELSFGRGSAELLALSGPDFTFDVKPRDNKVLGSIELEITVRGRDGRELNEHVVVMAVLHLPVVVTARPINRGQVIEPEDVLLEERPFDSTVLAAITRLDHVIGQEGRRLIRAGEMLEPGDLKSVPMVRRGELVGVVASSRGLVLEMAAKSLEDGGLGDVIEVRNEASRETFRARVKGLRQAEVLPRSATAESSIPQRGQRQ